MLIQFTATKVETRVTFGKVNRKYIILAIYLHIKKSLGSNIVEEHIKCVD